eukprot:GILJ01016713.1.p2 GENE.GILJ01016713.1~~GILJ01016713.1.p2  ORF type:complete len:335 (+),score=37.56 GILJ01016713.1:342-1346(+)
MCEPPNMVAITELLGFVGALCSIPELRVDCGKMFMVPVRDAIIQHTKRVVEDGEPIYSVTALRAMGTILIHLINGSKENKDRLPSWVFICEVMEATTDAFFQIQCVEILFRIAKPDPRVIDEWRHRGSCDRVKSVVLARLKGILSSPTDTLFKTMADLVEKLSLDGVPKRDQTLFAINTKSITIGAEENVIEAPCRVYFTPNSFTILMGEGKNADNITVPYTFIRSVRIPQDSSFAFKLSMAPHRIRDHLRVEVPGSESIILEMSPATSKLFRNSPVQKWVTEALERRAMLSASTKRRAEEQARNARRRIPTHNSQVTKRSLRMMRQIHNCGAP